MRCVLSTPLGKPVEPDVKRIFDPGCGRQFGNRTPRGIVAPALDENESRAQRFRYILEPSQASWHQRVVWRYRRYYYAYRHCGK